MTNVEQTIDIESPAFAARLANLLVATRRRRTMSKRRLAKLSDRRFSSADLTAVEAGTLPLDEEVIEAACQLYRADLGKILPSRLPVAISAGIISAGGVEVVFAANDSRSLLIAYLRLIRTMRRQKKAPAIVLRRDDIEELAGFLDEPGEAIVDRLMALMGATATQRTAMVSMFATGAIVIGLAGATAASSGESTALGDAGASVTNNSEHHRVHPVDHVTEFGQNETGTVSTAARTVAADGSTSPLVERQDGSSRLPSAANDDRASGPGAVADAPEVDPYEAGGDRGDGGLDREPDVAAGDDADAGEDPTAGVLDPPSIDDPDDAPSDPAEDSVPVNTEPSDNTDPDDDTGPDDTGPDDTNSSNDSDPDDTEPDNTDPSDNTDPEDSNASNDSDSDDTELEDTDSSDDADPDNTDPADNTSPHDEGEPGGSEVDQDGADKDAKDKAAKDKADQDKADQDAKDAKDAKDKADKDKSDQDAKDKADKDKADKDAKDKADKDKSNQDVKDRTEQDVSDKANQDVKDRAGQDAQDDGPSDEKERKSKGE